MTRDEHEHTPFRILLVCTANICRSPQAQYLLLRALGDIPGGATSYQVTSAGTHGYDDVEMDPVAARELRLLGGDPTGFRSQTLTDRDCEQADLILTATREQRSLVLARVPRALRRTFTLLEFAQAAADLGERTLSHSGPAALVAQAAAARGSVTLDEYDIADPYGGSAEQHRRAAELILAAVEVIAVQLDRSTQR